MSKKLNEGLMGQHELNLLLKFADEIGLKTLGDLERFKKEQGEGPILAQLMAYREELGDDFEIKEEPIKLSEKFWKYKLDASIAKALRNAIEDENSFEILSNIKKAYEDIHKQVPEALDETELEDRLSDLDFIDPVEDDDEEVEDNINYELSNLYDLCDAYNIWIPLSFEEGKKLNEVVIKKPNGKWANRSKSGKEFGEFDTRKEALAQMRAMYSESFNPDICAPDELNIKAYGVDWEWDNAVKDYYNQEHSWYLNEYEKGLYEKIDESLLNEDEETNKEWPYKTNNGTPFKKENLLGIDEVKISIPSVILEYEVEPGIQLKEKDKEVFLKDTLATLKLTDDSLDNLEEIIFKSIRDKINNYPGIRGKVNLDFGVSHMAHIPGEIDLEIKNIQESIEVEECYIDKIKKFFNKKKENKTIEEKWHAIYTPEVGDKVRIKGPTQTQHPMDKGDDSFIGKEGEIIYTGSRYRALDTIEVKFEDGSEEYFYVDNVEYLKEKPVLESYVGGRRTFLAQEMELGDHMFNKKGDLCLIKDIIYSKPGFVKFKLVEEGPFGIEGTPSIEEYSLEDEVEAPTYLEESLSSDLDKVKNAIDQFKYQITVGKESEQEVRDLLNNKAVGFMIDDRNADEGKLTFKLSYREMKESFEDFEIKDEEEEDTLDNIYHDYSEDELRAMGAFDNLNESTSKRKADIEFIMKQYHPDWEKIGELKYRVPDNYDHAGVIITFDPSYDEWVYYFDDNDDKPYSHSSYEYIDNDAWEYWLTNKSENPDSININECEEKPMWGGEEPDSKDLDWVEFAEEHPADEDDNLFNESFDDSYTWDVNTKLPEIQYNDEV